MTDDEFYADIVGVTEVAENLGVGLPRVRRWIDRRESTGCPLPVRILRTGHLYSMQAWRGWFALWRVTRGHETWRVNNVPDEQRTTKQR